MSIVRKSIIIISLLVLAPLPLLYTSCGKVLHFDKLNSSTTAGNPMSAYSIVDATCSKLIQSHLSLSKINCQQGVLNTSFSGTLGVPSNLLNPFRTLADAEQQNLITSDETSTPNCINAILNMNPVDSVVQNAYNPSLYNPFNGVSAMIASLSASCSTVYANNDFSQFPQPSPSPSSGEVIITFDSPPTTGVSGDLLSGVFQGVDFGSTAWRWNDPFGPDSTRSIYFDNNTEYPERSLTFSPGPKTLISITVFFKNDGTLEIRDDVGQVVPARYYNPDLQKVYVINTSFTQPSNVITIFFSTGWGLGVDDIRFK